MKLKDLVIEVDFEEELKDPVLYHIAKANRGYIRLPLNTTEDIPRGFKHTNKRETFLKLIDWVKTRPNYWSDYTLSEYDVYSGAINRDVYVVGAWVVDEIRKKGGWDIFCLVYPPHPLGVFSDSGFTDESEEMYRKWLLPSAVKLLNKLKEQGNVNEIELDTDKKDNMKLADLIGEIDFDLDLLDNSLLKEIGRGVRNYFNVYTQQDVEDAPDVVLELILEILEGIDVDIDYDKLDLLPQEGLIKKLLIIHKRKDTLDDLSLGRLVVDLLS